MYWINKKIKNNIFAKILDIQDYKCFISIINTKKYYNKNQFFSLNLLSFTCQNYSCYLEIFIRYLYYQILSYNHESFKIMTFLYTK